MNFNNCLTVVFLDELQKKIVLDLSPHVKLVDALPREILMFNCTAIHAY